MAFPKLEFRVLSLSRFEFMVSGFALFWVYGLPQGALEFSTSHASGLCPRFLKRSYRITPCQLQLARGKPIYDPIPLIHHSVLASNRVWGLGSPNSKTSPSSQHLKKT